MQHHSPTSLVTNSTTNNHNNYDVVVDPADKPIIATADDALTAKQATVGAGYYDDPFVHYFAKSPPRMVQPIIKRGTHARVACIDRAIHSFCKLQQIKQQHPSSSASSSNRTTTTTATCNAVAQIVILGAGMDTSFLRSTTTRQRQQQKRGMSSPPPPPVWFEVDHATVVMSKGRIVAKHAKEMNVSVTTTTAAANVHGSTATTTCTIVSSSSEDAGAEDASTTATCHCIGHDLRRPPSELMDKLIQEGFNKDIPTLFLLECVQMYLPEDASRALLSQLATSCKDASVVVYDPIAQYDAFGEVMERHLVSAGMAAAHTSLLQTRTLDHQLVKLTDCGFEIAVGCDMWQAYETILTDEQRVRANRCELLDELEEWKMLMQHYCLAVGSTVESGFCEVGVSSPMGFLPDKSAVSRKES